MKITIWTLASDTDNGLFAEPHATREDAEASRDVLVRADWESWGKGEYPGVEKAIERLSCTVGYMDSYSIEEHTLDVPLPPEVQASIDALMAIVDRNEQAILAFERKQGRKTEEITDAELLQAYYPDTFPFAQSGDISGPLIFTYGQARALRPLATAQK